jgi:hypothetical protein
MRSYFFCESKSAWSHSSKSTNQDICNAVLMEIPIGVLLSAIINYLMKITPENSFQFLLEKLACS